MHETLTTPLPASWLASRLRVDSAEIARLREAGELYGVWSESGNEWLYPAWQFGPGGKVPSGVRQAVKAARAAGLTEAGLVSLLAAVSASWGAAASSTCCSRGAPIPSSRRSEPRLPWPKGSDPRKGEACFALDSHS